MKFFAILLSAVSLASSAFFGWLSFLYVSQADGEALVMVAGAAAGLYGLANAMLLAAAWLRPQPKVRRYAKWGALVFAALYLIACLDSGMVSGLEFLSFLGLALVLLINYAAVSRAAAQQVNPAGSPTATA